MALKDKDIAQLKALDDYQVVLAQEGHERAFELLYQRWHPKLLRFRRRAADQIARKVKRRRLKADIAQNPPTEVTVSPDEALSLNQALLALPERDRTLLTLFYVDGMNGRELAAAMNLPLGTIKSRLFTARQKLKSSYQTNPKGDKNE